MKSQNYLNRVDKLKSYLQDGRVEGLLIENPVDIYYLTGIELSKGMLIILQKSVCLFVDGRYFEFATKHCPFSVEMMNVDNMKAYLNATRCLGFDSESTTIERKAELNKIHTIWKEIPGLLRQSRAIKDREELKKLRISAAFLWEGFQFIQKRLKVGVTEKEIAVAFEIFCLKNGAERLSFDPIIAFGKNTAFPHYHPRDHQLQKNDIVLCDIGVVVERYHSDMTRTFFYGHKGNSRLIELSSVVKKAQLAALRECRSGVKVGELDKIATAIIKGAGYERFLAHALGHGIGLEIHEYPRIKYLGKDNDVILQEGMVITIEPGVYIPRVGGVRHEDTVIITKKGYENLYPQGY